MNSMKPELYAIIVSYTKLYANVTNCKVYKFYIRYRKSFMSFKCT